MPATSPSVSSITSVLKPLRSQYFRYWRSSIAAQSQASVPPAPAWMSMKQLLRVGRVVEHAAEFELLDRPRSSLAASASIGDRPASSPSAFDISNSSVLSDRFDGQVVDASRPRSSSCFFSRPSSWARFGSFQTVRVLQRGVDFVQPQRFAIVVKDTPVAVGAVAQIGKLRADRVDVFGVHGR